MKEEKILEQVRADIVVEQAKLSNIQNEIAGRILDSDKLSDEKFTARMVQLEHDYQKKKEELNKKQAYLDDYMVRIDTKDAEASAKVVSVANREEVVSEKADRLEKDIAKFNQNLNDAKQSNAKFISDIETRAKLQIEKDQSQDLRDKNLDEREASFEATLESIDKKIAEDKVILDKTEATLAEVTTMRSLVAEESRVIRENLDTMQKEKQAIIQLSAIKSDIQAFEEEKEKFEKEKAEIIQLSKNVEARDKSVTEREITSSEKDKYQAIRERQIQGKIEILQKIRQGE